MGCWLVVFPDPSRAATLASEHRSVLLLVQPFEKFLETSVGQNGLHGIETVTKFIVTPGLVDEVLTRMTGRSDFSSTFAARHNVMPSCGHFPITKCANFFHSVRQFPSETCPFMSLVETLEPSKPTPRHLALCEGVDTT